MAHINFTGIFLIPAIAQLMVAGNLFLIWHRDRRAYLVTWANGIIAYSLGQIFLGLRDAIPDFLSIPLGNTLMMCGALLTLKGSLQFFSRQFPAKTFYSIIVATFMILLAFTYALDSILARTAFISAGLAGVIGVHGFVILRNRSSADRLAYDATAVNMFFLALLLVSRVTLIGSGVVAGQSFATLAGPGLITLAILLIGNLGIGLGFATMHSMRLSTQLENLSQTDPLSGLWNRRALDALLVTETERAVRMASPYSLLMIDIDHFKSVNDRFGHAVGDLAIQRVASVIRAQLRPYDVAARYGGEEFCVLLPHTRHDEARLIAERMRASPMEMADGNGRPFALTMSIGVASLEAVDENGQAVLSRADMALYEAKKSGRNRVVPA